ncbi:RHS repeat-associated core domain-containing protein [Nocardia higoensis]|uniref:RHS repeat-associated core domain-containing protein n=1 Tax=Nocardia higoensis TaxID=228599 RepID=UPI0002D321B3|nr:RHS repeat-associated core domain-containing protein [Nocardia higoensis]
MASNPLIAAPEDTTDWSTGISLVSSVTDLSDAISSGSWIDVGLGVVGLAAEAVSLVVDPFGTLAGYGVGWLIEHCQPLQDALDWIAGDPAQIEAYAKTWDNVATRLGEVGAAQSKAVSTDVADWTGQAATAYKNAAADTTNLLTAANTAATAAASAIRLAGGVVAAVRETVRDLVAQTVGRLAVWAAEAVFSLGVATPVIAAQATAYIAKTVAMISKLFSRLAKTMAKLKPLLKQLKSAFGDIAKAFRKTPSKSTKNTDDLTTTPASAKQTDTPTTPASTKQPDTPTNPVSTKQPDTQTNPANSKESGSPSNTTENPTKTTPANAPATNNPKIAADKDTKLPDQTKSESPDLNKTKSQTTDCGDPVDAATGEFLLAETDVELPGVLALVLTRRHRSSYRFGRWFGPSWAATLDMRVVVDQIGVKFIGPDGELWQFPHTAPDVPVGPVHKGIRARMTRTDTGGYLVHDPERELTWGFHPDPVLAGLDTRLGNYAITEITDRHHNHIRFHYSTDGTPTHVTHSGGYRVEITTEDARITSLTVTGADPANTAAGIRVREFEYTAGNLTSVTNGVGATTHYGYDSDARMLSWRDSRGTEMRNTYDRSGRVVQQVGTDGILSASLAYEILPGSGRTRTRHTNSLGATTIFEFDEDLCLRNRIDPRGATSIFAYNEYRQPVRHVDAYANITTYLYNSDGDLILLRRPDQQSITISYAAPHRPATTTDVDGTTTVRTYDEHGNLAGVTDADGVTTTYTHHPCGAPASITLSTGATTVIEVDPAGLPIRITEPNNAVTLIERDMFGRPTTITDPLGGTSTRRYSAEGKLLSYTDADGGTQSWTYDGEGNLLTHTNQIGAVTRYTYGTFDLVATREAPDRTVTIYTHDSERRLTSVTNPLGDTWTYEYDATGNLSTETDYNGSVTRTEYDLLGQAAATTTPTGVRRLHTYDILGRYVGTRTDTGEWIRNTYTPTGHIAAARNGLHDKTIHTVTFDRSPAGRIRAQYVDGHATTYDYDIHGRQTAYTTPSGSTTTYERTPIGGVAALTTQGHRFDFTHDPLGRQNSWRSAGIGQHSTYSRGGHTLSRELVQLDPRTSAPTRLLERDEYTWRPDGYITRHITTSPTTAGRRDYTLDVLGRITHITTPDVGVTEQYTYDALSNLTTAEIPTSPALPHSDHSTTDSAVGPRFEYRNNLLIRAGRTRFHYDTAGRLIRKEKTRLSRKPAIWHFRYNAFDQLSEVTTPDNDTWSYTYDPFGRRTTKHHHATETHTDFTWDGVHLTEQTTATDSSARTHTWTNHPETHVPLTQSVDDQFWVIITNLEGSPTQLADLTGRISSTSTTTLWGRTIWTGPDTPHRFQGQQHDPETGLYYNLHRYYDPETGRYLTQDPLGIAPAQNPNSYPWNPISWSDPLGLAPAACAKRAWADRADFSNQKVLDKKYDAHAADFGLTGNKNKANKAAFIEAMKEHMTSPDTKIYRFNYRNQGTAIGFIDPNSNKMVMLRSDGQFWSAWKLSDRQFSDVVQKGWLY